MAKLELKLDNIRAYGFPYACLMCGSDENPSPRKQSFSKDDSVVGYGCAFFFGPIGWLAALIYFLVKSSNRKQSFAVPICDCCEEGKNRIKNRDIMFLALGLGLMIGPMMYQLPEALFTMSVVSGMILLLTAALDHAFYYGHFTFKTLKSEADRVVLKIPNEDYPSLYQRHLDTAVLYGSVEHMGTDSE
ncbi:MAG: hypothetical protein KC800_00085 [Candidatus Eremiobacteraeota bacterium]|nr:hypothetical protein [Candidatus Eremiobacteraeota bacterium]